MSKQQEITREQLEEIVAEAVRDYMPGLREGHTRQRIPEPV